MTRANVTTDHKQIRKWAEARRGKPATMKDTEEGGEVGILRLHFDPLDKGLEKISWDEFFEKFDQAALAFLYQEKIEKRSFSQIRGPQQRRRPGRGRRTTDPSPRLGDRCGRSPERYAARSLRRHR